MPDFAFRREVRTPSSEGYIILEDNRPVGRADIHFALDVVHVTLAVSESLTEEQVQQIVDMIDDDLVDAAGVEREEMVVHVFQGRETGVYTDQDFSGNGNDR